MTLSPGPWHPHPRLGGPDLAVRGCRMRDTAVARASDDFYPRDPTSSHPHIAACAYNTLFLSAILHVRRRRARAGASAQSRASFALCYKRFGATHQRCSKLLTVGLHAALRF